ncbi:MAG: polysaccharide pyruvyl transferase family protein [Eubacterium sp.]|nr:polysaccharide pyruvyl transferase family protein [Eubacterium sp.]
MTKDYSDKGLIGACLEIKNNNYGSMLQSFATQIMLDEYGVKYELLSYKKKLTPLFVIKSMPRLLNRIIWQDKFNVKRKQKFLNNNPELKKEAAERANAFEKFRENNFSAPIKTYYGYKELKKQSKNYSAFLTGSDQLWSPSGLPTNFYNLMFSYDDATRISYASSFGVKKIPWYQRRRTKNYLNRIQFVSCREESGSEIVKELTDRDVPVVADPTILFNGDEWNQMLPSNRVKDGKYIFSYILGTEKKYRDEVLKLSKETGLPIVSIHQYVDADLGFGDVSVTDASPTEFVDLIRNAEYVCTDSFHGSVFSILCHRKLVIFNRYSDTSSSSKNTRIDNLCGKLGLSDRRFSGDIIKDANGEIDFTSIDRKLEIIRQESREYLEKAFDLID